MCPLIRPAADQGTANPALPVGTMPKRRGWVFAVTREIIHIHSRKSHKDGAFTLHLETSFENDSSWHSMAARLARPAAVSSVPWERIRFGVDDLILEYLNFYFPFMVLLFIYLHSLTVKFAQKKSQNDKIDITLPLSLHLERFRHSCSIR